MPAPTTMHLAQHDDADRLLATDPLALLIGMVLDQQIPLEHAFRSPWELRQRLGRDLDARHLASYDPDALADVFAQRQALHRFPRSMAKRVQEMCQVLVDDYDGGAAAVWTTAKDGKELLRNVKALPGFGEQKAKIFVALLGKQMGVTTKGWREAAGDYGAKGTTKSVADIDSPAALLRVRDYKREMKRAAKEQAAAAE